VLAVGRTALTGIVAVVEEARTEHLTAPPAEGRSIAVNLGEALRFAHMGWSAGILCSETALAALILWYSRNRTHRLQPGAHRGCSSGTGAVIDISELEAYTDPHLGARDRVKDRP
jgi:hypothetical protein